MKKTQVDNGPDLFSREAVENFIQQILPYTGSWINFRQNEDFNLSEQYSNEITPHAIYGFSVDRMVLLAEDSLKSRNTARSFFQNLGFNRRPFAVIFDPPDGFVDTANYKQYATHWETLCRYLTDNQPDTLDEAKHYWAREHYVDAIGVSALLDLTEYVSNTALKLGGNETFKAHPDKPRLWRELLLSAGVEAIADRSYTLTGDCDHQLLLLRPETANVHAVLENALLPADVKHAMRR